jgi:hypothetical protein
MTKTIDGTPANDSSGTVNPNLVRFTFVRDENNLPVGCIAYRLHDGRFEYEVSIHNPKDNFDRKMARKVAEGRLNKHPMLVSFDPLIMPKMPQLLRSAALNMINQPELPGGHINSEGSNTRKVPRRFAKALAAHVEAQTKPTNDIII